MLLVLFIFVIIDKISALIVVGYLKHGKNIYNNLMTMGDSFDIQVRSDDNNNSKNKTHSLIAMVFAH